MGILKRFKDIMSSNINALLDKAEDPEKMIDQYLRDLQEDLRKVKSETATVMAEEQRCKRQLDECDAEIAKMQTYAEKALVAGNEGDAMKFLEKKNQLTQKQVSDLNARKETIKAKVQVAKTQERMNKMMSGIGDSSASLDAFSRMEAKADAMLDKANAMSELNSSSADSIDDLASKYDAAPNADVQDELAALKAKMGL